MKKILNFFFHNWGLKVLALVLAVVVYFSLRGEISKSTGWKTPSFMKGPAS